MELKKLPKAQAIEYKIIALMLRHKNNIESAFALTEDDFSCNKARAIFYALLQMFNRKKFIDFTTVYEQLRINNVYDITEENLTKFFEIKVHSDNIDEYIEVLKEKTKERELVLTAKEIEDIAYEDLTLDEKIIKSNELLNKFNNDIEIKNRTELSISESWLNQVQKDIENNIEFLKYGLWSLDDITGGLYPGLHIVAGNTGSLKTTLAQQIIIQTLKAGKKVLSFSAEMSGYAWIERQIAHKLGIDIIDLKQRKLNNEQIEKIKQLEFSDNLYINEISAIDINKLKSIAKSQFRKTGVDLIVVDYIQLLTIKGFRGTEYEKISLIANELLSLRKDLDIPVVALAQLNRENLKREDTKPKANDIKASGQIENNADTVILLHRDGTDVASGRVNIIVGKNRSGVRDAIFTFRTNLKRMQIIDEEIPVFDGEKDDEPPKKKTTKKKDTGLAYNNYYEKD